MNACLNSAWVVSKTCNRLSTLHSKWCTSSSSSYSFCPEMTYEYVASHKYSLMLERLSADMLNNTVHLMYTRCSILRVHVSAWLSYCLQAWSRSHDRPDIKYICLDSSMPSDLLCKQQLVRAVELRVWLVLMTSCGKTVSHECQNSRRLWQWETSLHMTIQSTNMQTEFCGSVAWHVWT